MQANRNKRVYGPIASIEALHTYVKEVGAKLGVTIEAFASNHEGCILDEIHRTAAQMRRPLRRLCPKSSE
jgi:3-dehydroquinate dehydratase II